jgi:hypothetical protein
VGWDNKGEELIKVLGDIGDSVLGYFDREGPSSFFEYFDIIVDILSSEFG